MAQFHVNPETGAVNSCSAVKNPCPYGAKELHFQTQAEAQEFSELLMAKYAAKAPIAKPKKPKHGKLIVLIGVPGSGKSTLAQKLLEQNPGAVILNRDALRLKITNDPTFSKNLSKQDEQNITDELHTVFVKQLTAGGVVIDDNMNIRANMLHATLEKAKALGAKIEIIQVSVPLALAQERNRQRGAAGGRFAPEEVIAKIGKSVYDSNGEMKEFLMGDKSSFFVPKVTEGMAVVEAYNDELEKAHPIESKDVVLVDIDGTLCYNHEIVDTHLAVRTKDVRPNYDEFYKSSANAPVNASVLKMLQKLREADLTIVALTGRSDKYAEQTIEFLRSANAPISKLQMGRQGDYRGDYNVKKDILAKLTQEGFTVVHSIDDRPSSLRVWSESGITVSAVPYHNAGEPKESYSEPVVNDFTLTGQCLKCQKPTEELIHSTCRS